jgi:hypothetical protein
VPQSTDLDLAKLRELATRATKNGTPLVGIETPKFVALLDRLERAEELLREAAYDYGECERWARIGHSCPQCDARAYLESIRSDKSPEESSALKSSI